MEGIKDLTEIERLKFLKTIELGCSSKEEFEMYVDKFRGDLSKENVLRRVEGLFLEDEFLLLCKVMGSCSLINGLDQSVTIKHDLKVPDYIGSFNLADSIYDKSISNLKFNSFIEVKSTSSHQTKSITKNFISKYSKYSSEFNLPLLFASRIKLNDSPLWLIQTVDQLISSGCRVDPESMSESIGHILFNDFFIQAIEDIHIECVFTESLSGLKIYTSLYGNLDSLTIRIADKVIKLTEHSKFLYSFINIFPGHTVLNKKKVANRSIITSVIPVLSMGLLSTMILNANYSLMGEDGSLYTSAARFLAKIEANNTMYFDRTIFHQALVFFNSHTPTFITNGISENNIENIIVLKSLAK